MSIRILACAVLIALASFHAEAAKKKVSATPPAEDVAAADIDVDAMARAKDVGAAPAETTETAAAADESTPAAAVEASESAQPTDEGSATAQEAKATEATESTAPKAAADAEPASSTATGKSDSSAALALTPPIDAGEKRQAVACESRSAALLDAAKKGDFAAASKDFDAKMRSAMPPEKFRDTWASLAQFGALQARGQSHPSKGDGYFIVMTPLIFEHANLVAQVACGSDGRVAGFHVKPLSAVQSKD